ncbi:PREDICTED: uncharacterized protein LOC108748323 isoform X1 [Trachymyrmex septentrionalis]|uniref:uncharacterized protein LOC108748323 isoform X1 n=1 Tax=Trachymyrmex septentrionalis TaxID=34720 RepID=UPI00084F39C4|nr:PREDICTED: uncharacterized protein LOC108748323 isoform X1 [Trachymyrmex septentrionalis]
MIGSRFSGLSVCGIKPIHSISFTLEGVKKKWELIPLVLLNVCMMVVIPSMVYHRFFVSTIDIQPTAYQRFEIPSVPRFYDLRNPRSLKFLDSILVSSKLRVRIIDNLMRKEKQCIRPYPVSRNIHKSPTVRCCRRTRLHLISRDTDERQYLINYYA